MAVSKREINKLKCRQQILKTSRRLFRENGYDDTMIEEVADKAGISKATLYNYFPGKEDLLIGTLEDLIDMMRKSIREAEGASSYEKIKIAMEFLIVDCIPFIDLSRRTVYLNVCENRTMYGKANEIDRIIESLVDEAKEEGFFREDVASKDIMDILISIFLNSQFQWEDIEELTEEQVKNRIERMMNLTLAGCMK